MARIGSGKPHPRMPTYQVILPIRVMLLKKQDLKKYKALTALQTHLQEREEMGKTQVVKESVIPMVQQYKLQVIDITKDKPQSCHK